MPDDFGHLRGVARGVGLGEGVDGDDDRDLGVDVAGGGLPGDPFDESVGHDLVAGSGVAGVLDGVGVRAQCGQASHALLDGEEPGEDRHGVGCRRRPTRRSLRAVRPRCR